MADRVQTISRARGKDGSPERGEREGSRPIRLNQ
jgi:hypothetical protein